VFIHGCQAAKSRKWCNAFGIPKEAVSAAHFQLKGARARAFVGNTGLSDAITEEYQLAYAESLALFFDRWMANFPVSDCLQAATNAPEWWETVGLVSPR
jgi:hypothetical protein